MQNPAYCTYVHRIINALTITVSVVNVQIESLITATLVIALCVDTFLLAVIGRKAFVDVCAHMQVRNET